MRYKGWFDLKKLKWLRKTKSEKLNIANFDSQLVSLIVGLEPSDAKTFSTFQDRYGSQWLNVIPCKYRKLKLSNQQVGTAIGLQLGLIIWERRKCV